VLTACPEVELTLQCLNSAMNHILRQRVQRRPVLSHERAVLDYLRCRMAFAPVESLRVLFLDAANGLLADEEMSVGSVSTVHAHPREIVKRCLDLGATAILLAHNHPSGNPSPSDDDRAMTLRIARALKSIDVVVQDHLVVAKHGSVSFRRAGLL
jgi:DNA repair protein RadC